MVALVAGACSGWSLLPDVNGVLTDWSEAVADGITSLLTGAFAGQLGSISNTEWNLATAMTGKFGMVMGIVSVGLCAVQVIAGLVAGDMARVGRAAVWALLAWPATGSAVWLIVRLTRIVDGLAVGMLSDSGSAETIAQVFADLLTATQMSPIMVLIWAVVLWFPSVMLSLVMAFRNYALLLLVGFAPVAVMSQGWSGLRSVAGKWAQAVVALILTKIFAAGILVLAMDLVVAGKDLGALITGITGLVMACMAPAASMAVMSWAGGQIGDAMTARAGAGAGRAGRAATAPARNAMRNQTSRMVDQAANRVRESMKTRMNSGSKPTSNQSPAPSPSVNTQPAPDAGVSAAGAGTGAPATSGAQAGGAAAGASTGAASGGAAAGGAAGGGAAGGATAGAAAGPVGAAVGAGLGLAKSGVDKARSMVAGAAAQASPGEPGGQHVPQGGSGDGSAKAGDSLRTATAAMSAANDHLLTAPGGSASGSFGASASTSSGSSVRTAPGGPGGSTGAGSSASGDASGTASSEGGGTPQMRVNPGSRAAPRRPGPSQPDGNSAGPSLFGGR